MKVRLFNAASMLLPSLLIAACAINHPTQPSQTAATATQRMVNARYVSLRYDDTRLGPSSKSGLSVSAVARPVISTRTYRYSLTSQVNGDYLLMPNPPTLYTVVKAPAYKVTPRRIEFSINIYNRSKTALLPGRAIAALEINGETLFEKEILLPGIQPGNHATIAIEGPLVQTMARQNQNGVIRFGVYQVRVGDQTANFWWKTGYTLVRRIEKLPVKTVLRTPRESDAKHLLEQLRQRDGAMPPGPARSADAAAAP